MSDGIRVALPGVDVNTAPDYNLVFSSEWPNLKIAANPTVPLPSSSSNDVVIYTHNLGFVPAAIPFIGLPNTAELSIPLDSLNLSQYILADTQNIYFFGNTPPPTDLGLLIFAIDITKPFTAPIINAGYSQTAVNNSNVQYGIRVAKVGYDCSNPDVRKFILRSDCRSPMVHAVAPGPVEPVTGFSYTHDLPYNPIFFSFIQQNTSSNRYVSIVSSGGSIANMQVAGNTITVAKGENVSGLNASIVVLQDPFIISDNIITVSV